MPGLDPISSGLDLAGEVAKIVSKFIPDPQAQAQAQLELVKALQQGDAAQAATNTAEAANPEIFVSGWRPFIGWVCGAAMAYQFVALPLGMFIGYATGHPFPKPPALDDQLWQLMLGMLGMGGLRTYEKLRGVA